MDGVSIEVCSRGDMRYRTIRNRHYIPNAGACGQQVHFLVWDNNDLAGIISAGSSVFAVKCRDEFFGIESGTRLLWIPHIVNNTVFRLEKTRPNLGTMTLRLFRKFVPIIWNDLYAVDVLGFETFIVATANRVGAMYAADNWSRVGETAGSSKRRSGGIGNPQIRIPTVPKLVYCRWSGKRTTPTELWRGTWKDGETHIQRTKREGWLGATFNVNGKIQGAQQRLW